MENNKLQFEGMEILDFLKKPAIELNAIKNQAWGVAFKGDSIFCASGFSFIRIDGLKPNIQSEEEAYYSYLKEEIAPYGYPLRIEELEEQLRSFYYEATTVFPITNLLNRLSTFSSDDLTKTRVVITPTFLEENAMIMKFDESRSFKVDGIDKPFVVSADSFIPRDMVKLDTPYVCTILDECNDCYLVSVMEPYGKVRIGINFSKNFFSPERIESLNRLIDIPKDYIVCSNVFESKMNRHDFPLGMPPVHLDGTMFSDMLKVLSFSGDTEVEISISPRPETPIMIRNVQRPGSKIAITIFIGTLSLEHGIQRR